MLLDGSMTSESTWGTTGRDDEAHRVHEGLQRIAKARSVYDAEEASLLRDAKALRLWRDHGYATLFEYLECELGYAPRTAQDRIRVAEALEDLPLLSEALANDDLRYSAIRELTRVASPDKEAEWIDAACGKCLRQIEELVAGHKYGDGPNDPKDPDLRRRKVSYEVHGPTYAMLREARAVLENERGERVTDDEFLQTLCRSVFAPTTDTPTRPAHQISISTCKECKRSWQTGAGRDVEVDAATVDHARCDADFIGDLDAEMPARATSSVTPRIRRHVFARDRHRCSVPGCRSARHLEIHHVVHQADGGGHQPSEITLLCFAHHQLHHEGRLIIRGTAPDNLVFQRVPVRRAADDEELDLGDELRPRGGESEAPSERRGAKSGSSGQEPNV